MEMKSLATHPEVCDAGTEIVSDGGSTTNSPNGPTIHDPLAHSNHPAEPFLKGMHTLARGCPAELWLPRVRAPQDRFIPEGNAYGDLASTRLVKTIPYVAASCPTVHASGRTQSVASRKHPARGICNPYRIES
jgi:hypothetical protein